MEYNKTLGKYLKKELSKRGIYIRQVAEMSGTNLKTLYHRLDNDSLTAHDLFAISSMIGVDLNELRSKFFSNEEVDDHVSYQVGG